MQGEKERVRLHLQRCTLRALESDLEGRLFCSGGA